MEGEQPRMGAYGVGKNGSKSWDLWEHREWPWKRYGEAQSTLGIGPMYGLCLDWFISVKTVAQLERKETWNANYQIEMSALLLPRPALIPIGIFVDESLHFVDHAANLFSNCSKDCIC